MRVSTEGLNRSQLEGFSKMQRDLAERVGENAQSAKQSIIDISNPYGYFSATLEAARAFASNDVAFEAIVRVQSNTLARIEARVFTETDALAAQLDSFDIQNNIAGAGDAFRSDVKALLREMTVLLNGTGGNGIFVWNGDNTNQKPLNTNLGSFITANNIDVDTTYTNSTAINASQAAPDPDVDSEVDMTLLTTNTGLERTIKMLSLAASGHYDTAKIVRDGDQTSGLVGAKESFRALKLERDVLMTHLTDTQEKLKNDEAVTEGEKDELNKLSLEQRMKLMMETPGLMIGQQALTAIFQGNQSLAQQIFR